MGKVQERTLVKEGRRFPALVQEGMPSPHVKEILGHTYIVSVCISGAMKYKPAAETIEIEHTYHT